MYMCLIIAFKGIAAESMRFTVLRGDTVYSGE